MKDKLFIILSTCFASVVFGYSSAAYAEYYAVYPAQYDYGCGGYYVTDSCMQTCNSCGYSYYQPMHYEPVYQFYSSPRRHYYRSFSEVNEYAWIPQP